ncbi:MAG TPA: HEAT repeat domain-containing protein [Magnetospirillaceae bacterium]|nr:HEAT repeat domain-containing protein [Magnetospirillaceae bacterium]
MRALRKAALAALIAASLQGAAQTAVPGERTVEEAYLQETLETMIIREQSRGDTRDLKHLALQYIRRSIDEGRKSEEIRKALEYLALETSTTIVREAGVGRVLNDFPDIRARASEYLGEFPSRETKNTLLRVALSDREPMVISAAIRSLGMIGMNDNDEVTLTIAFIVNKHDILQPDNSLAFETLVAIERLFEAGEIRDPSIVRTILRIADGNYILPVRQKARQVLDRLRKAAAAGGR